MALGTKKRRSDTAATSALSYLPSIRDMTRMPNVNRVAARVHETVHGPAHRWWVLGAVECGNFVVYMDSFIVTLALPTIARQFGCGLHEVKWVLIAYLVSLTVCLLLAGRLADRFGRKPVTVFGMVALAVGAVLCAVAPSLSFLVASRVLQGLGGALVLANVMATITAVFPRDERRSAMALNASVLAFGQVAGLVLGGGLIELFGWRSIFVVILAVSAVGLLFDLLVLRRRPPADDRPFDGWGAVLSILAIGAPFFLIERLSSGLANITGVAAMLACLALVGIFVAVEARTRSPLIDLRLFRLRAFTCGSLAAAFYFVAATFSYFLVPLYAQVVIGLSPFATGLLMLPLSIALTAASMLTGKFSHGISARVISTIGLLCMTAGIFGFSFLGASGSVPIIAGLLVLVGTGGGIFHPSNNTSVLAPVPAANLSSANGFFTTARNFGMATGASLAAVLLVTGIGEPAALQILATGAIKSGGAALMDAYVHAQQAAFRIGAVFGLVGALLSAFRGPPFTK
jgi:EmrB/QacA subfamily drug resistance transporter